MDRDFAFKVYLGSLICVTATFAGLIAATLLGHNPFPGSEPTASCRCECRTPLHRSDR